MQMGKAGLESKGWLGYILKGLQSHVEELFISTRDGQRGYLDFRKVNLVEIKRNDCLKTA